MTSSRSFRPRGVAPGSRVTRTTNPRLCSAEAARSICVDFPAPSVPSKAINRPRRAPLAGSVFTILGEVGAAEDQADPVEELFRGAGLRDVVISSVLVSDQDVFILRLGGYQDHRHARRFLVRLELF